LWLLLAERILPARSESVDPDDLGFRILLLEELAHAADRAPGPRPADEVRDGPVGVPPDFRARRLIVGSGIRLIRILVGQNGVWSVAVDPFRDAVVGIWVLRRNRRGRHDDPSPEGLQEVDLLPPHLVR